MLSRRFRIEVSGRIVCIFMMALWVMNFEASSLLQYLRTLVIMLAFRTHLSFQFRSGIVLEDVRVLSEKGFEEGSETSLE